MNAQELTGLARSHIVELPEPPCLLHGSVHGAFLAMRRAAAAAGLDLAAQSSFRDFGRQLAIWNGKFSGSRSMNDAAGQPVDGAALDPDARIDAILMWSALPGASRHHWGTDIDLIDRNAVAAGYQVQLTPAEFGGGGPFAELTRWLEAHAARFGFFRPYRGVRSGVQAEPWHWSFAPLSEPARRNLTAPVLRAAIENAALLGKDLVLKRLDELHQRYVERIDPP